MANPGDIAIVGYSSDTGGKSFAFLLLADLSGQTINFTDNGWRAAGGFRANEGVVTYTVPANTPIGTVVTITGLTGSFNPATGGDQILAYLGTADAPTFLFAIDFADSNTSFASDAGSANTSAVPTGLTFGSTAIAFGEDNGAYSGPLTGTRSEILANIANAANWTLHDSNLPTYVSGFTVSGGPAPVGVSIGDASIAEGNSGTVTLSFTVTRTAATGSFTVDFATANGSATAGSDYLAATGTLTFLADGPLSQTVNVTINGDTLAEGNETFTVSLTNLVNTLGTASISDGSGTGTITNDDISIVPIHEIQGAAHVSPLAGSVVTTRGIVTAVDTNGFYIQTPDAEIDADVRTSQGIFVFTSTAPAAAVGDLLLVTGTVAEFTPGGSGTNNLSTTQLTSPSVTLVSAGNPLPAAIIMGAAGRPAPTEIIDDDNFTVFDPASDGIDYFESLEGMRVTVPAPRVVAPTTSNGEIFTVADNGANATGLSARGTLVTRGSSGDGLNVTNTGAGSDYNPERIQIDGDSFTPGGAGSIPSVNTGAVLNDVTGIVSYGFGNYEVLATSAVTVNTASILTADVTSITGTANRMTIATYNTLNLDPGDGAARFTTLALDMIGGLGSPDIIALQEIQDNSGAANDGTVSASVTLQMLVDAIAANGGPVYSFIDNPFITNNTSGGEPGGNIRVAYLYNAARVTLVAGSVATTPDAAADFNGSRIPLIATFSFNGEDVTVINNHFTSKGGSSPLFGAVQPSINGGAAARLVQAQNVADYVASLGGDARVVVLGDLNDFGNEESLAPLLAAGLNDLSQTLPATERYSYNFEGNAQQLDQSFVSTALLSAAQLDIVHRNSEFVATASTGSDHDPSVIGLTINAPVVPFGQPGDIAFVGFNADGTDDLAFVVLKEIPAGTVIYFNDQEWQGSAFNIGEGQVVFTATAAIAAGTVVTISNFSSTPSSAHGTLSGSTGLGSDSEIVYAYVGAAFAPTAFLAAIANDGFAQSGGTLNGTGLVVGETAVDLSAGGTRPGQDIAAFNGARFGQANFAAYRAIINNPANWLTQDGSGDQSADSISPDLPFDATAFILGGAESQRVGFQTLTVSRDEGNAGTTGFSFTVVRTGGTTGALEVSGSFAAGTTNASDFGGTAPTGFTVTIPAGQASASFTINISGDTAVEANESFSLTITSAINSASVATSINSATATATATISNDDVAGPALAPGDIAFVGFNADGNDDLAFVALKPLAAGTIIRFNDNEWQGTAFNSGEGELTWTATNAIAPGTVVRINSLTSSPTSPLGTVSASGSFNLAGSNEVLYAYVGGAGSPTAFLAAVANDGFTNSNGALTSTGLAAGQTAVDLSALSAGEDIAAYNGARNSASSFGAYAAIINTATNWISEDGSGDQSANSIAPDVPFSTTPFTLSGTLVTIDGIAIGNAPASLAGSTTTPVASGDLAVVRLGAIRAPNAGAESIAYADGLVFVTAAAANAINIHRVSAAGTLSNEGSIALGGLPSFGGVNAVDLAGGVLAVAYENSVATGNGFVALYDAATRTLIKTIEVGVLPDDVTFTPDGRKLIVANEAEALAANGSISIIDLSGGAANASVVTTIGFAGLTGYEAALRARGLAIAPGQPAAGDIEPEYVSVSADGTRAFVTLQEVNGVAVIDLTNPAATKPLAILPLGTVDFSLAGNGIDPSDQDGGINLRTIPVRGLLQPDAIASFQVGGVTYFATANEGDARVNVNDQVRLGNAAYVLDPTLFPDAAALKANSNLGRLNVLTTAGDTDGDGDFDQIVTYGGRSLSIFRVEADGSITKVRETGGEFEAIIAANHPAIFNSNQSTAANSRDTRSDDKGPEPESVTIGSIGGRLYAFVGLERVGGQMVYDVTDPANAVFVAYRPQAADDLGPETSIFVSAAQSPTGQALLISANEISNSVTLYSVQPQTDGNDVLTGGEGDDVFSARAGNDTVSGGAGNDVIDGGDGNDVLAGGTGIDTLSYASASNAVSINLGVSRQVASGSAGADQISGFERLVGSRFADRLLGSAGDDQIDGGAGHDVISGVRGNDVLIDSAGDDLYIGGLGADTLRFERIENGATDVMVDFALSQGDTIVLGAGITITSVAVSFLSTGTMINGEPTLNSDRSLDLILTLADGNGNIQTVKLLDSYGFASNAAWEAQLGLDLTYPRPLPTGTDAVLIG